MKYDVEIKPKAIKDGRKNPKGIIARIFAKIEILSIDLRGNMKKNNKFHY